MPDGALYSHARWAGTAPALTGSTHPLLSSSSPANGWRVPDRGDELLTDADGGSRSAIPDYAAGIVDQFENPTAHRKQITFAH